MQRLDELVRDVFSGFRPPAKLSLSEWADRFAVLSAESSAEPGQWKTIPYQKGIMDAFTDPSIEQVVVMKSARVGYTKIINHVIAYHIHQDPCSIMVVQPTVEDAEGYSKEEIAPMLRDTPALDSLVADAKAKDGSNTTLTKIYPGGTLGLVGANSGRGFRRVSRRIVLFDEVDGYPISAGTEGDQIKLGIRRTEYFWNRKIGMGSTPLVKDTSRIERAFLASDQRRYYVPCPQCGNMQYLRWANLKWDEGKPETAYFVCESGGCVIDHSQKRWMVERGEWRPTAQGSNPKHVGFHIWAAYSYSPNASWGQLASEFLQAKKDTEELKTFVNTVLGETWEEDYVARVGADALIDRAEFYEAGVAPKGVVIATAGIDVQDNRVAISIFGWGHGEESWLISHQEIYGDPSKPDLWKQVDDVILKPLKHEVGCEIAIAASGIDTGGHFTHEVYQFARERKLKWVIALKGQSQRGKPAIGKPTKVDVNFKGQILKNSVELFPVGTDTIKSLIYGRLKHTEPGPGYMHFHTTLDPEYFKQLTVEKQVIRYVKGHAFREWVKPSGARNEALDTAVYAYAALQYLYQRYNRATIFEQFQKKIVPNNAGESENKKEQAAPLPNIAQRSTINPMRKGKGFVGKW